MKKKTQWHGYKIGSDAIHVGCIPGRKQLALYQCIGNVIHVLAYFKTEEQAEHTLEWLETLAYSTGVKES